MLRALVITLLRRLADSDANPSMRPRVGTLWARWVLSGCPGPGEQWSYHTCDAEDGYSCSTCGKFEQPRLTGRHPALGMPYVPAEGRAGSAGYGSDDPHYLDWKKSCVYTPCRCHERMGNDFWFLPAERCLYDGKLPAADSALYGKQP